MRSIVLALENALRNDADLSDLLQATPDNPKVFPAMPTSSEVYPCITYFLVIGNPHAENGTETEQTYSLDIWVVNDYGLLQDIFARLQVILAAGLEPEGRTAYSVTCEFEQDLQQSSGTEVLHHKVTRWNIDSIA